MSFKVDKQTLDDLMIFGRANINSVFEIFNHTHSRGAMRLMDDMFRHPLSNEEDIRKRIDNISFFFHHSLVFPFEGQMFDALEFYLSQIDRRTLLTEEDNSVARKVQNMLGANGNYAWIHNGVVACMEFLETLDRLLADLQENEYPDYDKRCVELRKLANIEERAQFSSFIGKKKLTMAQVIKLDPLFRFALRERLNRMLDHVFYLDVYMSVAKIAGERGFCFPEVRPAEELCLKLKQVFHPLLHKPVANDLEMKDNAHVIFLTGANMAGKSTTMKTLSIALFLAHMGFPVPAQEMRFSVRNGMFTTINLPDNLNRGYSHFYTEVMRVKKVGEALNNVGGLIVLFDELFRGTNVKDAYDATLEVVKAFVANTDSLFIISTHITEVGEVLRKEHIPGVRFLYLPTKMEGSKPVYTYQITEGISEDRHGMMIVNNEKIVEIIKGQYHDF